MFCDESQQLCRSCRLTVVKGHMDVCNPKLSCCASFKLFLCLAYHICSFLLRYHACLHSSLRPIPSSLVRKNAVGRVPLCRFARKGSTRSKVDRRQERSGLKALSTCLSALMIHITGHLPGFVRYLAAPFRKDGCNSVSHRRPAIRHLVLVLTFLEELSSVNRSTQSSAHCPTTLEPGG